MCFPLCFSLFPRFFLVIYSSTFSTFFLDFFLASIDLLGLNWFPNGREKGRQLDFEMRKKFLMTRQDNERRGIPSHIFLSWLNCLYFANNLPVSSYCRRRQFTKKLKDVEKQITDFTHDRLWWENSFSDRIIWKKKTSTVESENCGSFVAKT